MENIKRVLLLIVLCMVLSGCSFKEKIQCKASAIKFLTAYQEQDSECGKYLVNNEKNNKVNFKGFQSILANSITFEVGSVNIDKDYNTVEAEITNVDFGKVFDKLVRSNNKELNTKEKIISELKRKLKDKEVPRKKFKIIIRMNKEQKIEMTSELSNALLGGYNEYIYKLTTGGAK